MEKNILGYSATILGLCIQIPQIIKILKTKSSGDLSYITIIFGGLNQILWGSYSFLTKTYPILISSICNELIWLLLLFVKIYYDSKKSENI